MSPALPRIPLLRAWPSLALEGLLWLGILANASAAEASRDVPYIVQSWQTEHGLPQNYVTAITQTEDGYLWIGTYNGLARFDGVRFVNFDPENVPALRHAQVQRLLTDTLGTLWITTLDGSLTSRRKGVFNFEWRSGAGDGGIVRLLWARTNEVVFALSSGRLLQGTGSFEGTNRWKILGIGSKVGAALADHHGTILARSSDGALMQWSGETFERLPPDHGLEGRRIRALLTDHVGRIWVGTDQEVAVWTPGVTRSNLDQPAAPGRFVNMTPTNGEPVLDVYGMRATSEGGIWVTANGRTRRCRDRQWVADAPDWNSRAEQQVSAVGYYGDRDGGMWVHFGTGLLHVQPNGEIQRITTEHGLANDRVSCWFQDQEGSIWLGLNRGGLVRLRPRHFDVLGVDEGLSDQVAMSVCEDGEGAIWIGTYGGGLNRWHDGVFSQFNLGSSNAPGVVVAVCPDRSGRVWVGTAGNGVFLHDGDGFQRPFSASAMENRAFALFSDSRGRMWMGNRRGLFCWSQNKLRQFKAADGFRSGDVRAIAEDARGAIWVGATDGEVYRYEGGRFTAYRPSDAVGRQPIWSLLADEDGAVWIGTFRGGLLRWKEGEFTRITQREGLPNNVICHILDDGAGQFWMSSQQGIFRVAKAELNAAAAEPGRSISSVAYGKFDGLPTVECSGNYQPAGWRGRDGRLWFATVKGVVSVQPREVTMNPLPPPVVIEELRVDGVAVPGLPVASSARGQEPPSQREKPIRVGPGRRHLEFRFTGLSLRAPDKVQFQYQLEGLDEAWRDNGTKRTISYSYVPPGRYRFRVRACNNDGVWNETGVALALVVVPYFWQTRWFLAGTAIGLAAMAGAGIRYLEKRKLKRRLARLERERAVERERSRIAQDIHDDLGASLTRITLLSESARDRHGNGDGESPAPHPEIDQIYSTARELTRAMDEIVWAVNPRHDTLDSLATYLGRFAQDFLRTAGLRCRLDIPMQLPAMPLSSEARHNLFLAFKEALHNVVKHAQATEVRIHLAADEQRFVLSVEDDGRGFDAGNSAVPETEDPSRISGGHGLGNIRRRLLEIGGRCEVSSRRGRGTRVEFIVAGTPGGTRDCREK